MANFLDWEQKFKEDKNMSNKTVKIIDLSNSEVKFIIGKAKREANLLKGERFENIYVVQENKNNKFVEKYAFFDYDVAKAFCDKMNEGFSKSWVRLLNKPIKLIL